MDEPLRATIAPMLLEKPEGARIALVILERRSSSVWRRVGNSGGKGRITSTAFPDEAAAEAALAEEVAARLAEGYVVTDSAKNVSDAFRSHHAPKRARRLLPSEIAAAIERALPPLPAPFAVVLDAVCEATAIDNTPRLVRIELGGEEGEKTLELALEYARGVGSNVDDYELDRVTFALTLEDVWPGESDGVELDVFADELRVAGSSLVRRFARGVRALPAYPRLSAIVRIERE